VKAAAGDGDMTSLFGVDLSQPQFWFSAVEIIWINILLSGDNAIVIALACRSLPPRQRLGGMVIGTLVAVVMRIAFAGIVSTLMTFPYIKIVGGIALLWIAIKLLVPNESDQHHATASDNLWNAVKIIALADIVMSLDNVIAVAAAAKGNTALLVFGLGVSIPAIVAGATIIMALLNYFPLLLWAGAALLGWIAGDVIASDPIIETPLQTWNEEMLENLRMATAALCAAGTVIGGMVLRSRQAKEST
jgi:YjbE family integral membrane protein